MVFAILNLMAFVLYLAAAVLNGAVLFLHAPAAPLGAAKSQGNAWARPLLWLGLLTQFGAIGAWCLTTHSSPFAGEYGTLAVLAWVIALVYAVADFRARLPVVGAVALLVACVVLFWGSLQARDPLSHSPLLKSQVVSLHVLAILASFGLFALAFGCACLYLAQNRLLKAHESHPALRRLPSLATLDTVAYHSVAYALPLLTLGLALGIAYIYSGVAPSVSANWFADPHNVLSFATWCLYVLYLGARLLLGWRGVRLQYILLAGLVVALAVYAMPSSTHHFTTPS